MYTVDCVIEPSPTIPNIAQGGCVRYTYLPIILLITPVVLVFGLASQVFKELENQVKKYGKACEQNSVKIKSQKWSRMWAGNPELWCCWQASAAQGGNHCIFNILTNLPAGRWDQDWDSLKTENPCAGCNKYTNTQIHKYTCTQIHKYTWCGSGL